jgi:hypothetical protein
MPDSGAIYNVHARFCNKHASRCDTCWEHKVKKTSREGNHVRLPFFGGCFDEKKLTVLRVHTYVQVRFKIW